MENHDSLLEEKVIIVPTREHKSLEIFLGKWAIEGQSSNDKSTLPSHKILGIETYEWLHGGFFLVYKWDRHFGLETSTGIGVFCHDESNHTFSITNYDNLGNIKTYQITNQKNSWKFIGENERATIKFNNTGDAFTEVWEFLSNDKTWQPLYQIKANKI